VPVPGIELKEN